MAFVCTKTLKLNNGLDIPAVALGTWKASDEDIYSSVLHALKSGYRHIDTAHVYRNEAAIGRAIKDSGVPREDLFITTKLWNTFHRMPDVALDGSLKRLGLDYVDLYLMHWPVPLHQPSTPDEDQFFVRRPDGSGKLYNDEEWDFIKTWAEMQKLLGSGKVKSIGVSNLSKKNITALLAAETTTIVPACNQVEMHPYLPQTKLLNFCKEKGIVVEAYCPLGSSGSPLLSDELLVELSNELGVSVATVLISWAVWRGTVVLPKSVTASRIEANIKIVELSNDMGEKITAISKVKGKRLLERDWGIPVFNDSDDEN